MLRDTTAEARWAWCTGPLLDAAERRLASRLVDHWDAVFPKFEADPGLWLAAKRLLARYGRDMIRRVESASEPRRGADALRGDERGAEALQPGELERLHKLIPTGQAA